MLLSSLDLLLDNPFIGFALLLAVIVSMVGAITVHEAAHALAATLQGDPTASRLGRLTLNPRAHLDPAGTLLLLVAGFGWGKPVPVDIRRLRSGRAGFALVSAAGPAANLLSAALLGIAFQTGLLDAHAVTAAGLRAMQTDAWAGLVGLYAVQLSLVLAAFNLLPVPPLDGGHILLGLAPRAWLPALTTLAKWGPIAFIVLVGVSIAGLADPLGVLFGPVLALSRALTG
ncbi:MAG: site-2 protease family protein [Chloroflexota bacterium]